MEEYYPDEFFKYFDETHEYHQKRYLRQAQIVERYSKVKNGAKLLDIGCAYGDFPHLMQTRGWLAEGVEPYCKTLRFPEIRVYSSDFLNLSLSEESYDVITAWAVLEHTHDPMAYFMKVAKLLKRGGIFVFLVTNFESISSKYLFREDIPRHLYFFSRKTISAYAQNTGFECLKFINDDSLYTMYPLHWLQWLIWRFILRRKLLWQELYPSRSEFIRTNKLSHGMLTSLRYVVKYPVESVDLIFTPLVAKLQILTGTYGILTCVLRKL
jgi:2-polyprenyl-3-methyl-5-hydroxy-6-metoxy-1,4-benzoquinol methylase